MSYDINSIESLDFREGVRRRIQMYLGSDDIEGAYQAIKEIINNSTDEALAGYGDEIIVTLDISNNSILVRDYGRGVPFGIRENGENVLVSIYTKSHTGGKFSHDSYKNASGLNGIGGSCVCLSASEFSVRSYRDGKMAYAGFEKGICVDYNEMMSNTAETGTSVYFIPDPEVFSNGDITYSFERISEDLKDISYLYPGIKFRTAKVNGGEILERKEYCAKNGIIDFVNDNMKAPLQKTIFTAKETDGTDEVEIAFRWGTKHETSYVFVNGLRCPEGGMPITGARTALTRTFNSLAEADFDGEKIRENLFYVVNCKVANPSFANQTKSKINNASLRGLTSTAFSKALKEMKTKYGDEFKTIVDMLKKIEKAERAAEKAREAVLNHEREQVANAKKKIIDSNKLRDAAKLGEDSTLLVVEGLSAGGSMSIGRDPNKYGILMLRGKAINCISNSIEDILENEEAKLLMQALGVTYGHKYNPKKLRYGRIAIATDADADGSHIGLLVMAMLYRLVPGFMEEGRLYWLKAPLYKLEKGKNVWYYYSEDEFQGRKESGDIVRYKGLGQMNAQDLKDSMFNDKHQHMEQLVCDEFSIPMLNDLMGDKVEYKKEFVFNSIDFGSFVYG